MVCIMCRARADICAACNMYYICRPSESACGIYQCVIVSRLNTVTSPTQRNAFKYIVLYVHTTASYLVGSYIFLLCGARSSVAFCMPEFATQMCTNYESTRIARHSLVTANSISHINEGQMRRPEIVRACMRKCVYL